MIFFVNCNHCEYYFHQETGIPENHIINKFSNHPVQDSCHRVFWLKRSRFGGHVESLRMVIHFDGRWEKRLLGLRLSILSHFMVNQTCIRNPIQSCNGASKFNCTCTELWSIGRFSWEIEIQRALEVTWLSPSHTDRLISALGMQGPSHSDRYIPTLHSSCRLDSYE